MTCREVHDLFSVYLYSELIFDQEEAFERHLENCPECQQQLGQERVWHEAVRQEEISVPMPLLAECRQDLRKALIEKQTSRSGLWSKLTWIFDIRPVRWSAQVAAASLLVFSGFAAARFLDHQPVVTGNEMGFLEPAQARVRYIEPGQDGQVQIVVDETRQHTVSGQCDDARIRRLLLTAAKDPTDPGLRVDSFEILKDKQGDDVRDALLYAVEHDPNPGVRLKALSGLRNFENDAATRQVLITVLSSDDNPGIRTQAIDLLVPPKTEPAFSPQLAGTLQELMRNEQNEYVRFRCQRVLHKMNASPGIY